MQIRRFQSGDEEKLFRVFLSSVHNLASCDYTPEQIAAWAPADTDRQKWAHRIRSLQPFIIEINGKIAGYADLQPEGNIDHFYVSGDYPRQGVGTLLMERILEEANRFGLTELTSQVSKTAEPFFSRYGFILVERRFPTRNGITLHNALMRKDLND